MLANGHSDRHTDRHTPIAILILRSATWPSGWLIGAAKNPTSNKFQWSDDELTLSVVDVCKYNCSRRQQSTGGSTSGGNDLMVVQCNASNAHGYVFTNGYINVFGQHRSTLNAR